MTILLRDIRPTLPPPILPAILLLVTGGRGDNDVDNRNRDVVGARIVAVDSDIDGGGSGINKSDPIVIIGFNCC